MMTKTAFRWFAVLVALSPPVACSDSTSGTAGTGDGGGAANDAGGGTPNRDAGDGGSDPGDAGDADGGTSDRDAGDAAADPCALGALCGGDGRCEPTPLCTAEAPCLDALVGVGTGTLSDPLTLPECRTTNRQRPAFDDSPARVWSDATSGEARAACVFRPPGAGPWPLVVFLHGSGGLASSIYDNTSLREKAESFELSPGIAGFVLASDQGPNSQQNLAGNPPSARHEVDFFDYGVPSTNPDFRNLDRLIDELVAGGGIDTRRIYLVGWSNGLQFAILYGRARRDAPTPGGHRIAAVAGFEAGDPTRPKADPECVGSYPTGDTPVLMVHRSCSIVACDEAQAVELGIDGNTDGVQAFIERLTAGGPASAITIDADGRQTTGCATTCTRPAGLLNHARWPDGVADGGEDFELRMLEYLRDHPLP